VSHEKRRLSSNCKIIGTKRLYEDGKFGKDGKAKFMATQWRGLEAPGKQQEKEKFPYLVNNGRANHVWQSIYLDQYNDFVMDRWPLPFLEMNPEDMRQIGLNAGDLVEVYNDNGSTQAMVQPTRRPNQSKRSCSSLTRPGRWETSPQKASTS
jgi:arsenite oxidase large subunit